MDDWMNSNILSTEDQDIHDLLEQAFEDSSTTRSPEKRHSDSDKVRKKQKDSLFRLLERLGGRNCMTAEERDDLEDLWNEYKAM